MMMAGSYAIDLQLQVGLDLLALRFVLSAVWLHTTLLGDKGHAALWLATSFISRDRWREAISLTNSELVFF